MAENYIVSARKYRPQTFDTVVGQEHITTTLKNAIRHQHLAHAYLFCGPRGVGKTTCARILARTINCEQPTADMEACGQCGTCQSFQNNASFNIFELDAASNNSVDDIRELVNQVRFAPQQGRYKIYIIDEVHMLSAQAFNAFLKTLEEPPPYAIFILATTEKHKILPTILSRCQIFDFKRITTTDISSHLGSIATKEGMQAEEAALHVIAQKSEGCMRDALSMLDRIASFTNGQLGYRNTMEHLNLLDADFYFRLTDHLLAQDVSGALLLLDGVLEKGFEGDVVLGGLAEHLRNLLLCKDARMAKLLDVPNDHRPVYYDKAQQTPPSFIISSLHVINDAELAYKNALNKRLHAEMCLIRLCYVLQATQLPAAGQKKNDAAGLTLPAAPTSVPEHRPAAPAPRPVTAPPPQPPAARPEPPAAAAMQAAPKPAAPPPPPAAAAPAARFAAPPPPAAANGQPMRRLSKGLLDDLDDDNGGNPASARKQLDEAAGRELFEQYRQKVRAENKSMLYAQLSLMQLEVLPPDEIRIIATDDLAETYAREQRNVLIDFYEQHGLRVRITTEVREDPNLQQTVQPVVRSKTEVFDDMASKNPNLRALKDGLNLQIEY